MKPMLKRAGYVSVLVVVLYTPTTSQRSSADEWAAYGADKGSTRYSPLDQINRSNVKSLRIVWRQPAIPAVIAQGRAAEQATPNFQATPIMVRGVLYTPTAHGTVAALDPGTGKVLWYDAPPKDLQAPDSGKSPSRAVAYWSDQRDARIIAVVNDRLIALNAETGARYPEFGRNGEVDLKQYDDHIVPSFGVNSPGTIVRDVIVIGSSSTRTRVGRGKQPPGDIRGYDVRSGRLLWTFHTPPRRGEFGADTWHNNSYETGGFTNAWAATSGDDELGYVYLALKQPNGFSYGGSHPGDNLFANSVVCLDAKTGKRVWHFQTVHHDIWDYDLPTAPILMDVTVARRPIKALFQTSKQGFVYAFDRRTGTPIWPIEERAVPKGNVPGEWYSPTQPFPTKPPAFDQQGVAIDDLIDFTPELRGEAVKIVSQYWYGPLFTPPMVADAALGGKKGSIIMPGTVSASVLGAAADPETGVMYVPSVHSPAYIDMVKPEDPRSTEPWDSRRGSASFGFKLEGPQGLPIFKPPYGRLTAIDMNKGEIIWTVANGNGPRDHPAIKHLNLPPLGQPGRASPLVTKTMVFLGEGGNEGVSLLPAYGGGKVFRAYDKLTGEVIWEMELPGGTTGAPMTYMWNGKQYVVVAVGWKGAAPELVALALP